MKEVLLIILCYVKLSQESLLDSIKSGVLTTTTSSLTKDSTNSHLPGESYRTFRLSTDTSSSLPEVSLTAKTVKTYKKQNGYKNQRGYTLKEQFHNKDSPDSDEPHFTPRTIPDSRFIYHSLMNPLFKSGTINLKSIENDNPLSKIKSDTTIHKISNPFDTKWLLLPGKNIILNDHNEKFPSSITNLNPLFDAIRIPKADSILTLSPDEFKFKPTGFANKTSLFAKNGPPATLANKTSIVIPIPKVDLERVDKKLNIFQAKSPILTTTTKPVPLTSTEKTFYSYNIEEVKTSDGKTRGTVQIFDEKGLKKNLVYDEKGVLEDKTEKTNETAEEKQTSKVFAAAENTTAIANVSQIRPQHESVFSQNKSANFTGNNFGPRQLLPSEEIESGRPLGPSSNSFATPEFILYDFLGQLGGSMLPYVPNYNNFVTNEVGTMDEAINENSFFYSTRK